MGGHTNIFCLSVLVFYIATASCFVVIVNVTDRDNSVETVEIESKSSDIVIENWYNWYSVATSDEADNICGTTDKEYNYFEDTQSCYKVHTEPATWAGAEDACSREGGHLAVINDANEAQIVAGMFPNGFRVVHVGFRWIEDFQTWVTVNGQTLPEAGYANWSVGEPNNITGKQYCGSMYPNRSFDDIDCSDETAFICEKKTFQYRQNNTTEAETFDTTTDKVKDDALEEHESLGTDSLSVEDLFKSIVEDHHDCGTTDPEYTFFDGTQSCYKVHTEGATWSDAEATCVREGGHLAVINSLNEAVFIVTHLSLPTSEIYLGFHWNDSSWVTVEGQTLAEAGYENWYEGGTNKYKEEFCGTLFYITTFNVSPCQYELPFICEKGPKPQVPATTEVLSNFNTTTEDSVEEKTSETENSAEQSSVEALNKCGTTDTGYKFLESTKSCYKVHTEKQTWSDAEATCVREGGHLAVINSQDEADFLTKHFPPNSYQVFLGFHWTRLWDSSESWITIQGETLADTCYENWNTGEPNNLEGQQNCGSMYPSGKFDDIECYVNLAFICEKNSDFQYHTDTTTEVQNKFNPSDSDNDDEYDEIEMSSSTEVLMKTVKKCGTFDTEYTFYESTQSCYKLHTERATWSDAEATCVREGGHLAVINSQHEADIIKQLHHTTNVTHIFIGFSYRELDAPIIGDMYEIRKNGDWLTIDGQTLSEAGYESWTPGEPNNAGGREYCGTIYSNGKFDDSACYNEFAYICEKVF